MVWKDGKQITDKEYENLRAQSRRMTGIWWKYHDIGIQLRIMGF